MENNHSHTVKPKNRTNQVNQGDQRLAIVGGGGILPLRRANTHAVSLVSLVYLVFFVFLVFGFLQGTPHNG